MLVGSNRNQASYVTPAGDIEALLRHQLHEIYKKYNKNSSLIFILTNNG